MSTNNPPELVVDEFRTLLAREPAKLGISLDIARGLAALFVFCFHISGASCKTPRRPQPETARISFEG
jgi:hypothetical protein